MGSDESANGEVEKTKKKNGELSHSTCGHGVNKKKEKSCPDSTATHNALRRSNKSHSEVITLPSPASDGWTLSFASCHSAVAP